MQAHQRHAPYACLPFVSVDTKAARRTRHAGQVLISAGCCLLAAVLLGLLRQRPLSLDTGLQTDLSVWLDGQHDLLRLLVLPSELAVLLPAVAVIAAVCLWQRRPYDAVLAVVAPVVAVGLNTWVLKPLFGLLSDGRLEYPSGHTASLVAVGVVFVLLARPGVARWVAVAVVVLITVAAGAGMVALGYHYPVDIAAGALVGVGVVQAGAVIRRRWPRRPAPAPSNG